MINLKEMLLEKRTSKSTEGKGCLMAMISKDVCKALQKFNHKLIKDEDLYIEDDEFGREKDCHVTIRFGFTKDLNELDVRQLLKGQKEFTVEIYELDKFEPTDTYDVIMFKVKSPIMEKLNQLSSIYPNESDFPDYHPHITLAYVKKGTFTEKKEGLNIVIPITEVCYSPISGGKSYFPLEKNEINENMTVEDLNFQIKQLENEWDKLDGMGVATSKQNQIAKQIELLSRQRDDIEIIDTHDKQSELAKDLPKKVDPTSPKIRDFFSQLRQITA